MITYKVYFNLYDDQENRLSNDERDKVISQMVADKRFMFLGNNKNTTKDKHYPLFYSDRFYFGSPLVFTGVHKDELEAILAYFKEQGLKWWVTYAYRMLSFQQIKDIVKSKYLNHLSVEARLLSDRNPIFLDREINLVTQYRNGHAIITNETDFDKIICQSYADECEVNPD